MTTIGASTITRIVQRTFVLLWMIHHMIDCFNDWLIIYITNKSGSLFEGHDDHWGKHNCLRRSELETICPEGDFSIEVGMYLPSQVFFTWIGLLYWDSRSLLELEIICPRGEVSIQVGMYLPSLGRNIMYNKYVYIPFKINGHVPPLTVPGRGASETHHSALVPR